MKLNKALALVPLALGSAATLAADTVETAQTTPAATSTGFEYTGYLRAGVSTTADGGEQYCFGSGSQGYFVGRLGNECDSYAELGLGHGWKTATGATIKANTMLSLGTDQGGQGNDYQSLSEPVFSVPENGSADIALRQLNVTATDAFESMPGATIWAGKRYYKRKSVEAMDLYYLNNSGYGGGIEDIKIGFADLSVALVNVQKQQLSGKDNASGERTLQQNIFDVRFDNIDVFAGQKLDVALAFSKTDPTKLQDENDEPDDNGAMITTELHGEIAGFNNHFVVQYGQDALADSVFSNQSGLDPDTAPWWEGALDNSTRLINFGDYQITDKIDLGYVLYAAQAETIDDSVPNDSPYQRALILAPGYQWDQANKTILEVGTTAYKPIAVEEELTLHKIVLAHEFTFNVGLPVNPVIRAYTGAFFGDEAEEYRNANADGEDGNIRVGLQAVANW